VCGNRAHQHDNSAARNWLVGVKLFALLVRFSVRPGHEDAFDALVAETLAAIAAEEPDTIVYASHTAAEEPTVRVFYECYRSHDAFQAHEAAPHIRRFLSERTQHLASPPEVWTLAPVAGAINGRPLRGDGAPR
jgi:quinol monooxygenase YgiN